jgi:hypothetical protein
MLTGTCEVCHETMPFAEHLEGTTVRCNQCGQGRLHVAATTGITASLPRYPEQRITPPDTAIADRHASALGEPVGTHRPAPGACPRCGSTAFKKKRLKAQQRTVFKNDRECKECGTPYTTIPAPMSITARTAMYMSGALLILGGHPQGYSPQGFNQHAGDGGMSVSSIPLYAAFGSETSL